MRYGPPVAVVVATTTDPRSRDAWQAAASRVPGGDLVVTDVSPARLRPELEHRVLATGRWAAARVEHPDGDTVVVVAPRRPGTELDAYRILWRLAAPGAACPAGDPGTAPGTAGTPVRERWSTRRRAALPLDPRRAGEALAAIVAAASPGHLRTFTGDGNGDGAAGAPLDRPDEEGGSALLLRPWALPAPPRTRLVEHTDDPATHYPLALRPDTVGGWWVEHAPDVVDHTEVTRLIDRLGGSPGTGTGTAPRLVHERIRAHLDGDATAVVDGQTVLGRRELDRRSGAVARALRAAGVRRGDAVGLHLPRSADAVVALVAILRVGGTYVPLDPDFPDARLRDVAARTGLRAVVRGATPCAWTDAPDVAVDPVDPAGPGAEDEPWEPVDDLDGLYVLFTSGSTGRPKGVVQTVGAVSRLVDWHHRTRSGPGPHRVVQFATLNFDVASQEILTALALGHELVVAPPAARRDPALLVALLRDTAVTEFFCPQVLLQEVCRAALRDHVRMPALRHVYQSGEPLVMNTWLDRFLTAHPAVTLHNHYGPTETHVITAWPLPRRWRRPGPVDLGPLATGSGGHVLGPDLRPVVIGEIGELYAADPQVGRGYVDDPALTALRFVADPTGGGGRVYRTGDLVRDDGDGRLAFVGRADHQTKIRGHRVEPEEVTACLLELPEVDNAATFVVRSEAGENRLESVLAGRGGDLRDRATAHLRSHLPAYLVPSALTVVDAIARTATGKVDREATLAAAAAPADVQEPAGPGPDPAVGAVWEELLGGPVAAGDDFFARGGTSITAIHLARRLSEVVGVRVSVGDVVAHPTPAALAAVLTDRTGGGDGGGDGGAGEGALVADPGAATLPFPLLDQQQAYLIGRDPDLDGGDVACHLYLEYSGDADALDVPRLERALDRVVRRHPTLRTVFDTATFTQRVLAEVPPLRIEVVGADDPTAVRERLAHEQRPFDTFPLFTVVLVRGAERAWLCLSLDALLVDARSTRQLLDDWQDAYARDADPAGDPGAAFRDYVLTVARRREGAGAPAHRRAREYWARRVPQLPPPPRLPTAGPPGAPAPAPRFVNRRRVVPASCWSAVTVLAGRHGVTPSGVLLTAYAAALAQWSAQPRFLLNVPRFGRRAVHERVDGIVGEFASFDLLDVDTTGDPSFAALAARLGRRLAEDLDHDELSGMEVLRELLRHQGAMAGAAAPVVFTSELGVGDGIGRLFGGRMAQVYALSQTPQVWMDLLVGEEEGALVVRLDVVEERFPREVVDGVVDLVLAQVHVLADAAAWVEPPLRAVAGDTAVDRGRGPAPVDEPPALLASITAHDGDGDTHRSLLAGAGLVAERVRAAVAPDDHRPVAVALTPGPAVAAAVLGVLATGRAYLPLDVESPPARLEALLGQVAPSCVVTDLPGLGARPWPRPVVAPPEPGAPPAGRGVPLGAETTDVAAVLFTSGSTGTPRAVPVPTAGLRLCVAETIRMTGVGAGDRSLALARAHHDMSVFDLFVVPAAGGEVVHPPPGRDPRRWAQLVAEHQVTAVCAVPAAVEMLLDGADDAGASLASLRTVLTGGDRVPPELVARLRAAAPAVRVWSIGGPTETTAWNIAYRVPEGGPPPGWSTVPYGRALPGTTYRVVDDALRDRPERAVGELVVSGPGVTPGYLGGDGAVPSRLVPDPATGETLYRTGDLGTFRDGLLEFHGRADRQLEIRGHRVEPGEVEAALREHRAVTGAAVVPLTEGTAVRGLAAFVTGPVGGPALSDWLADRLPSHLVPRRVEVLDALPQNRAGKVDRLALAERAAASRREPAAGADADGDPLLRLVCDVWAEELGVRDVGPADSFFALGGDSMSGFRLVVALRELFGDDVGLSIRSLLESRTVEEFVGLLRRHERHDDFARVASLYAAA